MKILFVTLMIATAACGPGSKGEKGDQGEKGERGEAGAKGDPGQDAQSQFENVRVCSTTLIGADTFWDGLYIFYQAAFFKSGDVMVNASTGNAGTLNETATAFYPKGTAGAADASLTLGVGDSSYLSLSLQNGSLIVRGRGLFEAQAFQYTARCMNAGGS